MPVNGPFEKLIYDNIHENRECYRRLESKIDELKDLTIVWREDLTETVNEVKNKTEKHEHTFNLLGGFIALATTVFTGILAYLCSFFPPGHK